MALLVACSSAKQDPASDDNSAGANGEGGDGGGGTAGEGGDTLAVLDVQNAQPLTGQCVPGFNYTDGLWYIPRVERAFFGFKVYHTLSGSATAWLDDVAISTKRIGCPAQ